MAHGSPLHHAAAAAAANLSSSPAAAGVNPAPRRPSLLPAFEPPSSSPGLPRPPKRKLEDIYDDRKHYPTPVPTSSTAIIPSSSPPPSRRTRRPAIQRSVSTLSERAPLGDVPTLSVPDNGEPLLLGRSSNSSNYQLPGNRQISRVHVQARYSGPNTSHPSGVLEIQCLGWNGIKVHCRGEVVELAKEGVFRSDLVAPIMVDVQDTRVMLLWPKSASSAHAGQQQQHPQQQYSQQVDNGSPWAEDESPLKRRLISDDDEDVLASSPPQLPPRLRSPVSPTPAALNAHALASGQTFASTFRAGTPDDGEVKVYEDHSSDEDAPCEDDPELLNAAATATAPSGTAAADAAKTAHPPPPSKLVNGAQTVSPPSEAVSAADQPEEFSEHDEENDPVIHSFGPFGENILSRLQSFQPTSPEGKRLSPMKKSSFHSSPTGHHHRHPHRSPSSSTPMAKSPNNSHANNKRNSFNNNSPIKNHVINQLAYSRIHSLPLSQIHSNLPSELRGAAMADAPSSDTENPAAILTASELKTILDGLPCVGEIAREGKDAHGKLLESEFYYVPEMDGDEMRRDTVMGGLGKTSLRAARKSHKQYYWKRPR